jgi:formate dehydrogenase major subunit
VIEGSNMAECHPVAFRWVMKAKLKGATIIHVDPRFTRTSAVADLHAPIRAGSDIAFLGGLVNYVVNHDRWNRDPFFHDYLVNYTNAATIIGDDFKDTEDLDGVFSGLEDFKGDPINGFIAQYNGASWQYKRTAAGEAGRAANTGQSGEQPVQSGQPGGQDQTPPKGPPFDPLVQSLRQPPAERDTTLENPRTVFQIVKRHFGRYTPEMVERVTGCPKETFFKVGEALLYNSGVDRTSAFCYAVGWTQHTDGPQLIGTCALLQLLLGNIGRPGGGVMALRGHATIQGSTDVPTLYHSIHGYMAAPSVLKKHDTLQDYLATETLPTSYWANQPKFMVSYLKSVYGDAATADNDFGYAWHPRIDADHSHMPMMINMIEGKVRGMFAMGQNPAVGGQNAHLQRKALAKLEWLVVKDNFETETAAFWYNAPEVAEAIGADPAALDLVAHLLVTPLLQASRRHLAARRRESWPHGYCPVCGSGPALAEILGLERVRHLRCARCGGDWAFAPLRCPSCGERDHRRLGTLVSEDEGDSRKVDVCENCRGYVKSIATLGAWPALQVGLEDLASVDLDVIALDRGYARPEWPGTFLRIHLVPSQPLNGGRKPRWRW